MNSAIKRLTKKRKAFYLSTPLALIIGMVVLLIVLSVFFGLKGTGLFGKVGKATDEYIKIDTSLLKIGGGEVGAGNLTVPKAVIDDFNKIVEKFGQSKTSTNCYIQFGALPGLAVAKDEGFQIVFEKQDKGTLIYLKKVKQGAEIIIKGQKKLVEGISLCIVHDGVGTVPKNFEKKYKDNKKVTPFYLNTTKVIINGEGDFSGTNTGINLGFSNNILFKPSGDKTCFIPTRESWGFGNEGASKIEVNKMFTGQYTHLSPCSAPVIESGAK